MFDVRMNVYIRYLAIVGSIRLNIRYVVLTDKTVSDGEILILDLRCLQK